MSAVALEIAAAAVAALLCGTLVEYWLHRLMHHRRFRKWKLGRRHAGHHKNGWGKGVLPEFLEYNGAVILAPLAFLVSWQAGVTFAVCSVAYAFFAAYAHQVQHEDPRLCFWMRMPVHFVHHRCNQWTVNFGIAVDWWDRVFGTYEATDWRALVDHDRPVPRPWQVHWRRWRPDPAPPRPARPHPAR